MTTDHTDQHGFFSEELEELDEQDSGMEEGQLPAKIIGRAMRVHCVFGPGFLESLYAKALAHELREAGLEFLIAAPA